MKPVLGMQVFYRDDEGQVVPAEITKVDPREPIGLPVVSLSAEYPSGRVALVFVPFLKFEMDAKGQKKVCFAVKRENTLTLGPHNTGEIKRNVPAYVGQIVLLQDREEVLKPFPVTVTAIGNDGRVDIFHPVRMRFYENVRYYQTGGSDKTSDADYFCYPTAGER